MDYLEKNKHLIIPVLVVIILVLIFICVRSIYKKQKFFTEFINGVWNMNEDFCEESGLDSGFLAIDNNKAYLLLHISGEEPINEPIEICGNHKFNPDLCDNNDIYLTIKSENDAIKSLYPERMHCIINIIDGVMIWKDGDDTLAIFDKINSS